MRENRGERCWRGIARLSNRKCGAGFCGGERSADEGARDSWHEKNARQNSASRSNTPIGISRGAATIPRCQLLVRCSQLLYVLIHVLMAQFFEPEIYGHTDRITLTWRISSPSAARFAGLLLVGSGGGSRCPSSWSARGGNAMVFFSKKINRSARLSRQVLGLALPMPRNPPRSYGYSLFSSCTPLYCPTRKVGGADDE